VIRLADQGNRMNTVCGAECASHRPYRAGDKASRIPRAALRLPGAIFTPSLWDERPAFGHSGQKTAVDPLGRKTAVCPPGGKGAFGRPTDWNRKSHLEISLMRLHWLAD
jgi:hypothetical protein